MPGAQLSEQEIAYIKQWRFDEGDSLAPSTIARRLGRNKSTITRHINRKSVGKWKPGVEKGRRGPARKLTKVKVDSLPRKLSTLVKKAKRRKECPCKGVHEAYDEAFARGDRHEVVSNAREAYAD